MAEKREPSTRETGADVANVGTGRERPIVGRSERRIEAENRPSVERDQEVAQRASGTPASTGGDQPAGRPADAGQGANGYAGRIDREDPSTGLGGNQSGERQSHELPGVGNRPARPMSQSGARISDFEDAPTARPSTH